MNGAGTHSVIHRQNPMHVSSSPIRSFLATHRFRPTLLPTVAMVAVAALAIALGNWQRHRADEKSVAAALASAAALQAPLDLDAAGDDARKVVFRTVHGSGEYVATRVMLIDNKVRAGRAGFEVVTPLRLASGNRYVLVDRGWVAQGPTRKELPSVQAPAGVVEVVGRAIIPPPRYVELKADTAEGPLRQNLDIERIAASSGLNLLPFVVEQADPVNPPDGLVRDWPQPDFGIERHLSYMGQWYSLAGLAIVLWLVLNWQRRKEDA
jgi:surfeit locus 1 family protein